MTFALRFKPLDTLEPLNAEKDDDRIMECNCSICQRVGGFHPHPIRYPG